MFYGQLSLDKTIKQVSDMQCKYNMMMFTSWAVTYLGPGLPRRLGLCGHGALQLNGQSDVLAAWGGGREIKVSKKKAVDKRGFQV